MLDAVLEEEDRRSKSISALLVVSLVIHAIFLAGLAINGLLKVEAVQEPSIAITFVDFASAPPPPPPPPPKKHSAPKTPKADQPKPVPKEFVAPKEIPKNEPPPQEQSAKDEPDEGPDEPGAEEGGVEGGVAGGVAGGVVPDAPPPPKVEAPAAPVFVEEHFVRERRIAGYDPAYPESAQNDGIEGTVEARIVISPDGRVTEVSILKGPAIFHRTVRDSVLAWRFRPQNIDGKPASTYTIIHFVFRLE